MKSEVYFKSKEKPKIYEDIASIEQEDNPYFFKLKRKGKGVNIEAQWVTEIKIIPYK